MRASALGLALLLAGCHGVPWRPEAFDRAVRVETLELSFAQDGTGLLSLKLEVRNPASELATLTGVDFELWVEGRRLSAGLQQVEVPLGANGLPHAVALSFPLVSEAVTKTEGSRPLQVGLRGGARFRYGEGTERRAPFHAERALRLEWVPVPEAVLE
ncbi:hypothetical protein [Hyalangium rubrum]|uniref:Lipoprotein n=1 Tax=Hyalangium rubrum TaxID=3103134 RepID=A0ABU5H0E8_9BACT|nr:hypothetical protein [Hyalangium sp. s54d21]MDY7226599.1 hypothetical protein [Hyalangium sp. s54d21]